MGLAGEHDLDLPPRPSHDLRQPIQVAKDEPGPFVLGEAAAEADGQYIRTEERVVTRSGDGRLEQAPAELVADLPQLAIGDIGDAVPTGVVDLQRVPVGTDEPGKQRRDTRGHPGRHVDPVGNRPDRHLAHILGPGVSPQPSRHGAVELADADTLGGAVERYVCGADVARPDGVGAALGEEPGDGDSTAGEV